MAFTDLHEGILGEFSERQRLARRSAIEFDEKFTGFSIDHEGSDATIECRRKNDRRRNKSSERKAQTAAWKKANRERVNESQRERDRKNRQNPAWLAKRNEAQRIAYARKKAAA